MVLLDFSEWAAQSLLFYLRNWSMDITVTKDLDTAFDVVQADLIIIEHDRPLPASLSVPVIRLIPLEQPGRHSSGDAGQPGGARMAMLSIPLVEERLYQLVLEMLGLRSPNHQKRQASQEMGPQGLSREMNILLVEDDRINQLTTEKMLHKLGYQVDIASNGDEALLKMEQMDFDLVLMDCQLPGMSGFETALEIKKQQQDSAVKSPILALTANVREGEEARCIAAGMDGYLAKPVHVDDLDVKLRQFLI